MLSQIHSGPCGVLLHCHWILTSMENDEYSMQANLNGNMQELVNTVPEWEKETQVIHPKWLEHHQSGHLTKDPGCPVCMEEAGSKVNHRRRKGDRSPGIMHCDLAAFKASADGHRYCLVAAVTIEINHECKLLPFFVPMPKKDAVCAARRKKHGLCVITATYTKLKAPELCESKQMEVVSSPTRRSEIYAGRRT